MEVLQYREEGDPPIKAPVLELSGTEWAFPLVLEQGGHEYVAGFRMTPYAPRELDELLRQGTRSERRERNWMKLEGLPLEPICQFFDRHFGGISGIEGEPPLEEQRAFLDRRTPLKRSVFLLGYGGFKRTPLSANGHSRFVMNIEEPNRIETEVPLWSLGNLRAETVKVTHILRTETKQDFERFNRAARRTEWSTKGSETRITTDHLALGDLYNAMAVSLDGALWKGQPCGDANREDWVKAVPLWHKSFVMDELFTGVEGKNV